jgi:hypothetical protein
VLRVKAPIERQYLTDGRRLVMILQPGVEGEWWWAEDASEPQGSLRIFVSEIADGTWRPVSRG